jgi:hypothetical protein
MNRTYYETPKPSKLMLLFWKIAGADRYLLEKATYQDQIKYFCLGGIILATGVMATLAGGYAFYTIFSPKNSDTLKNIPIDVPTVILSMFFGLIWGAIIFNIDRFIVTSTGKGDGTEKITWDEFKGAIPRIIMGAIIAITISKPVEIRIFQSEIDTELNLYQDSMATARVLKNAETFKIQTKEAQSNLMPYIVRIKTSEDRIKFLDSMVLYETFNGGCKGKCEENKRERTNEKIELNSIKQEPDYIKNKNIIANFESKLNDKKTEYEDVKKGLDGLLIRIQLAHKVTNPENHFINWISLFITLLFLVIELTPIFFKLMLIKTPYDYMEENIKELIKAENGIEVKYNYYADDKSREGMEQHLVINHNVEKEIYQTARATEVQKELMDYAIEKYTEKMKAKIDANPEDYIKEEELNKMNPKEA